MSKTISMAFTIDDLQTLRVSMAEAKDQGTMLDDEPGRWRQFDILHSRLNNCLDALVRDQGVDAEMFHKATGESPVHDELERCNCKDAGEVGHRQCGWCIVHWKPRFQCGCR